MGRLLRGGFSVAPIAFEVLRQVDRQARPHVLAYRAAREVDGYLGRWTAEDGTHWVVLPDRQARPIRAFPPLPADGLEQVHQHLDRSALRHHLEVPEARAAAVGRELRDQPRRLRGRLRRRR